MMPASNLHTHTLLCDGADTAAAMAAAAFQKGFVSFGFSGHSPLPYENDYAMTAQTEQIYRTEVAKLKQDYDGKMEIFLGLELDADSPLPEYPYDFLISSVHQLHPNGSCYAVDNTASEWEDCIHAYGGFQSLAEDFYQQTVTAALRSGIDIIGHFDLITKFNEQGSYFDPANKSYQALVTDAADQILNHRPDLVFEVNTGAMSRKYRNTPYPDSFLLRYLAERKANIMINSDTHAVTTIDFAFDTALGHCAANGVKTIYRLRKAGWEAIAI